jgi:hypothetical protein
MPRADKLYKRPAFGRENPSKLPDRRLTGNYPETGFEEIGDLLSTDVLEEDFWPRIVSV